MNQQRRSAALQGRYHAGLIPKVASNLLELWMGNVRWSEIEADNPVAAGEQ
jgi:hypothetical protein